MKPFARLICFSWAALGLLLMASAGCDRSGNTGPVGDAAPPADSIERAGAPNQAPEAATAPADALAIATASATPPPVGDLPVYRCPRVATIPDGETPMDPAAAPWTEAPEAGGFLLCDARTPASRKTRARMVWDDQALYVLFHCDDPNVFSRFTQDQDPLFKEEVVEVFLDPAGEGRDYFEFEISPQNKRFAAEIHNNGEIPPRFRSGRRLDPARMTTRVLVDGTVNDSSDTDRGWTVFVRIPFAMIDREAPSAGDVWRGNLYRIDLSDPAGGPDEFSCWSPTHSERPNFHISRYFGKIEFIQTGSR